MHDPREEVTPDGTIRTGATRNAIAPVYDPILRAAGDVVEKRGALYVYGSVATGTAVVPTSDVDLLSIGLPAHEAARISAELSARFRDRCRAVSIGAAMQEDLEAASDEAYGLRVFLRHYCVHLEGADPASGLPEYPADARAVRGFNGDVALHRARWWSELEQAESVSGLATRIARKTLLAVAGLVSLRDATWSTDRRACAARWDELEPRSQVTTLVGWLDAPTHDRVEVQRELERTVASVVRAFETEIGLWPD